MGKINKDEIKWWIEDHKGKFYAICGGIGAVILAIVIVVASQFKSEPVIEAPEEDKYEELDIGGFNQEEQIQKEDNEESKKQEKEFGVKFEMIARSFKGNFSYVDTYDYGFMDILIDDNQTPYQLYVDDKTFESGVLSKSMYSLMDKNEGIFSLRCKLEDLPEETKVEWQERDKRKVLDLFRNSKVNKETAKEWNNHLSEVKVSKGFNAKDKEDTIGEEKWNEIMDEMYSYFEDYLLGLENEETGAKSPLKEYLKENPYPNYDKVKVAKSPVYLCDVKARSWSVLTSENLTKYANAYWNAYYADAKEIFLNQDDIVDYSTLDDGTFYKLKKSVDFLLECSSPEEDIVVWYMGKDGDTYAKYIPSINTVWENQDSDNGGYYENNNLKIDKDTAYFGYFIVGETYKRDFVGKIPFESTNEDGELVLEHRDLEIKEKIKYTREQMLGEDITIYVSEFLMLDGPYRVDFGDYYIMNDTEETVLLYTEDDSSSCELLPGDEIYVDWSIKSFMWRVER